MCSVEVELVVGTSLLTVALEIKQRNVVGLGTASSAFVTSFVLLQLRAVFFLLPSWQDDQLSTTNLASVFGYELERIIFTLLTMQFSLHFVIFFF